MLLPIYYIITAVLTLTPNIVINRYILAYPLPFLIHCLVIIVVPAPSFYDLNIPLNFGR